MDGRYAGVDWASEKHDVLVADAAGEKLLAATFAHDEPGLRSLCRQLVHLSHIFAKLNIASRAELAAEATRRGLGASA
jgi:hypothetical protein